MPPTPARMSTAAPSAGLAVMPDMPSEPPHCRPTTISLTGIGSRSLADLLGDLGQNQHRLLDRFASRRLPDVEMAFSSGHALLAVEVSWLTRSRAHISTPPKFGWRARPACGAAPSCRRRCRSCRSPGRERWERNHRCPDIWQKVRFASSAIAWQTVAEQLTLATMPMKLRVPARPSARRYPMKVRVRSASVRARPRLAAPPADPDLKTRLCE